MSTINAHIQLIGDGNSFKYNAKIDRYTFQSTKYLAWKVILSSPIAALLGFSLQIAKISPVERLAHNYDIERYTEIISHDLPTWTVPYSPPPVFTFHDRRKIFLSLLTDISLDAYFKDQYTGKTIQSEVQISTDFYPISSGHYNDGEVIARSMDEMKAAQNIYIKFIRS